MTRHRNPAPTDDVVSLGRDTVIHLAPDQSIATLGVDETDWAERDRVPQFRAGRVLSVFDYATTWTWWERHPDGEEFVLVLSGSVRFCLDDGETRAVALSAGEALVVPRDTWHRAELMEPARILFVTPVPERTEHRDASKAMVKVSHG